MQTGRELGISFLPKKNRVFRARMLNKNIPPELVPKEILCNKLTTANKF
jgi:hypothetical protein